MTGAEHRVGPWRVGAVRAVYANPWIEVIEHEVARPDGSPGQYGVVRFKNRAIGVLPLDDDGNVTLVGQHRFPLDRYSWELPEGGGGLSEEPLDAARRELKEETGLSAGLWLPLIAADLSNSVTDETAFCFLAADLAGGPAAPDPSEDLAVRTVPFSRLYEDVLAGEIRDSLTIIMALAARARALRGEFPASISRRLTA